MKIFLYIYFHEFFFVLVTTWW